MFFHIDESGNTGNNLFDFSQPRLSYGVLSSTKNSDVLCKNIHKKILEQIGQEQIHANVLGIGGLCDIAHGLIKIQKRINFDFDYYFIDKTTFALTMFFDSVFDAGLNEAVKWDTYWTPLRYLIIHKLTVLFDEELLKKSWDLCISKRIENRATDIVSLLSELKKRTIRMETLDERSKELMIDAFEFGINKPLSLDFGTNDSKMISPNAVGFQFVLSAIARRTRQTKRKNISSIIVDRQSQFNNAQLKTHLYSKKLAKGFESASPEKKFMLTHHPLYKDFSEDEVLKKGLPDKDIAISKSSDSIGLQIVDVYLWIANKLLSDADLPKELLYLWSLFGRRILIDGISLEGMGERFSKFSDNLPATKDISEDLLRLHKEKVEEHRQKVRDLSKNYGANKANSAGTKSCAAD
ncbi:MAG: hypothetical protein C4522_16445 [Desulfobacteraceae bacterium]|nr:MAG: hypothetical protein C4522_16445 [Desulfobacteraceae bacterium]